MGAFQTDNNKYTRKSARVNVNNPDFNNPVELVREDELFAIREHLQKWKDFIAYFRWYPDLYYDLIKPERGRTIRLGLDQRIMLRCLVRFKSTYGVMPRGSGKCITGDTLLLTTDGIKEIGSYFDYQKDNNETIKGLEIEIVNRYGEREKTVRGIYSGKRPTVKITTQYGFCIEGTYVHPLLVRENRSLKFKKLQDIRFGTYVCMRRGDNIWGNKSDVDIGKAIKECLKSKQIPDDILCGTREVVVSFLKRWFGCNIAYNASGKIFTEGLPQKLARQLQTILLNLNILSFLKEEDTGYVLYILDENVSIYNEIFLRNGKAPISGELFSAKVIKIERSEKDVYDIETTETHSFMANGFVNHNTMVAMMYAMHACVFYPHVQVALTAQTKENAAKLVKDKYDELTECFPLLKEEIYSVRFNVNDAYIEFHNGSKIISIANAQSSKGAHVQRGIIDEDNLTNEEIYQDVLEPIITTVPRITMGDRGAVDPFEINGQISQLTSAGFRGSSAFFRCLKHFENMIATKGEVCLGAGWELACHYGRGATKAEILKKQQSMSCVAFDMNYRAVWTGVADNAVCSMNKLMDCRNLYSPEFKCDPDGEYVFGVDVARSDNATNNQSVISVLRVIRRDTGKVKEVRLVNLVTMEGTLDYAAQALKIKELYCLFKPRVIVCDDNGLSKGVPDALCKVSIDPLTGDNYGCFGTINSEREPEIADAPKVVFCYVAQKYDQESIPVFIDAVETGKLRLLTKKDITAYMMTETSSSELMPFFQTNCFVEEVSNLKLEHTRNGALGIQQVSKKVNKDRFSAVQYPLWYIMKFLDGMQILKDDDDCIDYLSQFVFW